MTAGLAAHALDGPSGGSGDAAPHGDCRNCGTPLAGDYCHACGQAAHLPRTMRHIVDEFVHGILHLDGKTWRTLPMLLVRPGKLTRDYIHGHRARYIAPLALFLFTVFLMFFAFAWMQTPDLDDAFINDTPPSAERTAAAEDALSEARAAQAKAEAELKAVQADPDPSPGAEGAAQGAVTATTLAVGIAERALAAAKRPVRVPIAGDERKTWQEQVRDAVLADEVRINIGSPKLQARIRTALLNPDLTLYKIQQKAYKLSFLLVPLSLPFVWLLFPFRPDVTLYDHTVFTLYSLSFMSLLFIVTAFLVQSTPQWTQSLGGFLSFLPPVHMFLQLKGAYALGWRAALWRTVVLSLFAVVVLSLFTGAIVFLGLVD